MYVLQDKRNIFDKGRRRRGMSGVRWLDCIMRDTKKTKVEHKDWRTIARYIGQWRKVMRSTTYSRIKDLWKKGKKKTKDVIGFIFCRY